MLMLFNSTLPVFCPIELEDDLPTLMFEAVRSLKKVMGHTHLLDAIRIKAEISSERFIPKFTTPNNTHSSAEDVVNQMQRMSSVRVQLQDTDSARKIEMLSTRVTVVLDEIWSLPSEYSDFLLEYPDFMSSKMNKIRSRFGFEDMFKLLCFANADYHHRTRSQFRLGLRPWSYVTKKDIKETASKPFILTSVNKGKKMNTSGKRFSLGNTESCIVIDIERTEELDRNRKMRLQLKDNSCDNLCKHKDFKLEDKLNNQHKRTETAQRVSSFAMATIIFLWVISDQCSQLSIIQGHGPVVIWSHLLGLLSFMVFVWAVAIMILVGAQFSRMQNAMLVFWAILMLVGSYG